MRPVNIVAAGTQGISGGDFTKVIEAIRDGNSYVNIHTAQSPGGEARVPAAAVRMMAMGTAKATQTVRATRTAKARAETRISPKPRRQPEHRHHPTGPLQFL
jgi:hypothetical protein